MFCNRPMVLTAHYCILFSHNVCKEIVAEQLQLSKCDENNKVSTIYFPLSSLFLIAVLVDFLSFSPSFTDTFADFLSSLISKKRYTIINMSEVDMELFYTCSSNTIVQIIAIFI